MQPRSSLPYTSMMRNIPVAVAVAVAIAVAAAAALTLTGCGAQQQPLRLAGGIRLCLADRSGMPAGLAINATNAGGSDITIDKVTSAGANIEQGTPWLLPADGNNANTIGGLVAPFAAEPHWSRRKVLGRGTLKPGQYIAILATVRFPVGGVSGANIGGVDVDYTTADGAHHTAHSNVHARFSSHC
jgi:hypothetical protein